MRKNLSKLAIALVMLWLPGLSYGQTITLGTARNFVLFTSAGAVTNSGTAYLTKLTGNVGTNSGSSTGFGNVDGGMHDGNIVSAAAKTDLNIAYIQLNTATPTSGLAAGLGGGQTLVAGVYAIPTAATLNGEIILNAQGNANAVFIFQINGGLSTGANAKVRLINGALACNVYWKTEGAVNIGNASTIRGTIVANNAAISFGTLDSLEGRALSTNGAITLNSLTAFTPLGCGSTILTGPVAPTLGAVGSFALFTSIGPVSNGGATSYITGDIGSNLGSVTNYNPLFVNGTIHTPPNATTAAAATALTAAYGQLNTLPIDITLLYPAIFGHNLVLTPHTYLLNAATTLTDTLYLNAQGNPDAVFVINVHGALNTIAGAKVLLVNGTQSKNVYWKVNGAVNLANNAVFHGTIIASSGAIDITTGAKFYGRALTTTGAITTNGDSINAPVLPATGTITGDTTVCVGSTVTFSGVNTPGVWSATNNRATVSALGIVTGVAPGIDTIIYSVTNNFGTVTTSRRITVMPLPNAGTISGPSAVCTGSAITLTTTGTGGMWTATNPSAIVAGGMVTGISTGLDTIRYTVTNSCGTAVATKTVAVNPIPDVMPSANQTVCNGTAATAVIFTGAVAGTTYSWSNSNTLIGLPATGTGNIPSFVAMNPTNLPITGTITVTPSANGCTGTSKSFTITVNPTPNAANIANQAICNGAPTTAVIFTGTVAGTTFTWTNDNITTGLPTISGTGIIPVFMGTNSTSVPNVSNIVVTPTANGCTGTAKSFSITINPTPTVAPVANQVHCNGEATTAVIYTGTVAGTTYSWTNNNSSIGLASAGMGNIPSFTAMNNSNVPSTGVITITPTANGCNGNSGTFTITVNPTPRVDTVVNQAVCNGLSTKAIDFTSMVNGTSYVWNNNNPSIGLGSTGTGNIPSFTAINNTDAPITAMISVIPTANGCQGPARTFTITVNRTPVAPVISLKSTPAVCHMTYFRNYGAAAIPPAGISYAWSTDNAQISDVGNTQQYALVNFKKVGIATVILTATETGTGCLNTAATDVSVTANVADMPAEVVYFNKSFICLQNDEEAYAWGYDDAATLAPTVLAGEINQDYVNASPNLVANRYWVMVSHNGCMQKTYYNKPEDAQMKKPVTEVSVFPNPADQQVTIAVKTSVDGIIQMEVFSLLGQKMHTTTDVVKNPAINVSAFPSGVYTVVCYRNNERISTTRFIKN